MMDKRAITKVRTRRILQLLGELGVSNCTETKLKALSGGERKRVALAVQVCTRNITFSFVMIV